MLFGYIQTEFGSRSREGEGEKVLDIINKPAEKMPGFEDLIPTVNKLQDVLYASGIDSLDLPILAVVGSQSSGKSSILETLVGRDFLPRGTGIVTRRPLVLQLNNLPSSKGTSKDGNESEENEEDNNSSSSGSGTTESYHKDRDDTVPTPQGDEWGEFLHKPGQKFYDFAEIRKEIENETARLAGNNKGISKVPINLKIFSPHVLNLTLVDLPGITKVPIGEQPHDIEQQVKNLILDYVTTPNCLILAVSPANVDLVNSESLKLAKEVDPEGKRTIGVITKLDLMDSGTNAMDILLGKVYPLKLGFVGVVNRSQQDIQLNIPVRQALDNEDHYFQRHPVYRTIANKCGTRYLAKLLNKTLLNHIKDKLPDIRTKLNMLITQTEKDLLSYGPTQPKLENKAGLILHLINGFSTNFISAIDGNSPNISTKELCGGARIYYIYNHVFSRQLNTIDPVADLSTSNIKTAIRNSTGPRATLFVPELAFDLLVKPQIKLLEGPSQTCVELVFDELMKICQNAGDPELERYPNLKTTLIDVVSELLRERLGPTHNYVESLIDIHRAYINTNHPKFVSATEVMSEIVGRSSGGGGGGSSNKIDGFNSNNSNNKLNQRSGANGDVNSVSRNSRINSNNSDVSIQDPTCAIGNAGGGSNSTVGSTNGPISGSGTTGFNAKITSLKNVMLKTHDGDTGSPIDSGTAASIAAAAALLPPHRVPATGSTIDLTSDDGNKVQGLRPTNSETELSSGLGKLDIGGRGTNLRESRDTFLNYFFGKDRDTTGSNNSNRQPQGQRQLTQQPTLQHQLQQQQQQQLQQDLASRAINRRMSSNAPDFSNRYRYGYGYVEDDNDTNGLYDGMSNPEISEREELECELIRRLIISYFDIVREMIQDQVPKAIMCFMVNYCKDNVQNRLVSELYKESRMDSLLQEDMTLVLERKNTEKLLETYKKAAALLNNIF